MIYGGHFDPNKLEEEKASLEEKTKDSNFWSNQREAEKIINQINNIKKKLENVSSLQEKINNNLDLINELKNNSDDELQNLVEEEIEQIGIDLDNLEVEILLSGKYDSNDAILELHSGAGGTEACDWTEMLYRMYDRWCFKHNYKIEVLDQEDGDTAGIKSITLMIKGINAYGYLKSEKGVHRLVRISPFDSNKRRHTSFASVDVIPNYEVNDIDIEIKDSDIRVDVYRSSGKGGQGVNTTDSAVRITHIPTKIVVTCQNERSQIQNKATAMMVLKNKLYQLELQKRENELSNIKGDLMDINFGSQIRSYVMHPYSMVKDHRTNTETSQVDKVMDGDIDIFINSYLKDVK